MLGKYRNCFAVAEAVLEEEVEAEAGEVAEEVEAVAEDQKERAR